MRQTFEDKLTEIIRPEVEGLGCRLWGLSSPNSGKKRIVRIYIEDEKGATIDQCAKVSRQVGLLLEVEDIIPGAFTLEVSSPGLERRFFSPEQMNAYKNKKMTVRTYEAIDGQRKFIGELVEVEGDSFTITLDSENMTFDWSVIKDVRLVHEF